MQLDEQLCGYACNHLYTVAGDLSKTASLLHRVLTVLVK